MAKLDLTTVDIRSLIERYSSDLRLLDYQASAIKSNITALEEMLEKGVSAKEKKADRLEKKIKEIHEESAEMKAPKASKAEKSGKKGPGRPRLIPLDQIKVEVPAPVAPAKKDKAPKGEKVAKKDNAPKGKRGRIPGFNRWEEGILSMLKDAKKPLKNEDLMEIMHKIAARDNVKEGNAQLKIRLNQALVKLGNKLELLNKEPFEGKGYLYSLK